MVYAIKVDWFIYFFSIPQQSWLQAGVGVWRTLLLFLMAAQAKETAVSDHCAFCFNFLFSTVYRGCLLLSHGIIQDP